MNHSQHAKTWGMTLIELLVAIAIFALLGLMSYRSIHGATESQARLSEEFATWQQISRTLGRLETELMQIGVRMQGQPSKEPALRLLDAPNGGKRLVFWRLDANQGARLTGLEWADERLSLLRWKTADTLQEPTRDVLLEGVQDLHVQFAAINDPSWHDSWPVSLARNAEAPTGIRLDFELAGKGRISRVYALR